MMFFGIAVALLTAGAGASGCAEYVAYDADFQIPGGQPTPLDGFMPTTLDHLQLRGLMSRYLLRSSDGVYVLVDFDAMAASPEARFTLDQYRAMLASVDPSTLASSSERLAYWVNGYNASVIHGIINNYKGDPKWRTNTHPGFFSDPIYGFGGENISLNQLEQGVMRAAWDYAGMPSSGPLLDKLKKWHSELWPNGKLDARFHAAINCGAVSCPNLLDAAPYVYMPATIDAQMTAATKAWLDSKEKGANSTGICALFEWYTNDFNVSHGSVDNFITTYRTDGLKDVDTSKYLFYDWTLNIKGSK